METKHTPRRPLNAKLNKAPDDGIPYYRIESPHGVIIARVKPDWGPYFLDAVNSIDALKACNAELVGLIEHALTLDDNPDNFQLWIEFRELANAAIAKEKEKAHAETN